MEAASKAGKEAAQRADDAIENADDALKHLDEAGDTLVKAAKRATQGVSQKKFNDIVMEAFHKLTAGKALRGGNAGQEILEIVYNHGIPQKHYKTSMTYRVVDLLENDVIHESKVGYKAWFTAIERQALKDSLIVAEFGGGATWHFFRSEITGLIGADKRLLDLLDSLGIEYYMHG